MNCQINLPYGTDKLTFHIPEEKIAAVLSPGGVEEIPPTQEEILRALANPIGCQALSKIGSPTTKVVILCDDNTRLTPANLIVPAMLQELAGAGVRKENMKIIMALGTHRPMTPEELKHKLGAGVVAEVEVINHDFRNPAALHDFGLTENGTPVKVNRLVLAADVVIGIGSIVPHHIPGYSGGAKIVQPGICGEDTTAATHLLSVRTRRNMLGIVENRVREEMEAIADKAGVKYVFNTVLDPQGRVVKAFFGDIRQAFRAGVETSRRVYGIPAPGRTPIVLASSHPCDLEFWQAHKTLYPCDMLVEEGGSIIIVTPCPEGVAVTHPEMLEFAGQSPEDIDAQIEEGIIKDKVAGALALAWAKVRRHAEVCLVSHGIGPEMAAKLGFKHAATVEEALDQAWERLGKGAKVTVLTHGADTLPLLPEDV
ncbi:Lactate racemase [Neomoorella glycerini]|uniref:Lactate racemase n=1 Tax=Neomoorella glycerini TaxID=55779 RepID=A0A6I5ZTS9_9FIRM|nr:nickel-dependent lactate racemase [Moorella glycerini]QGP92781.1 Lactate racemase [Moorella glycerini]